MSEAQDSEKLAGRLRAIEAVLAELPEVTEKLIDSAMKRMDKEIRGKPGSMQESGAKLKDAMKMPLDEHAHVAFESLKQKVTKR